jgi:hypothetical protein
VSELQTRHILTLAIEVGARLEIGDVGGYWRRSIPILSGTVSGIVSGRVLPGADWQMQLADGTLEIEAHYALQTDDGARIEVISNGLRTGSPEALARLAKGERLEAHEYYFRTAMRFRTGEVSLARFNRMLAVARGERFEKGVRLEIFEVL